jgi:hypothetical protein
MSVKVVSVVLCDEVRREVNGDAIIIGAKQAGRSIPEADKRFVDRLGLYIELETNYPPPNEIEIRLYSEEYKASLIEHAFPIEFEIPEGIEISESQSGEDLPARGVLLMVINREQVEIEGPGEYTLQFRHSGKDWVSSRSYFFPFEISGDD